MRIQPGEKFTWAAFRAWWLVVGLAWRASRWRAVAALGGTVATQAEAPLNAIGIGALAAGIGTGDRGQAYLGAGILTAVRFVRALIGATDLQLRMTVRQQALHEIDVELIDHAAGAAGVEHFERADHADQMMLLEHSRDELAAAFDALCFNVGKLITLLLTFGILSRIDGWLLLLPIAGLPAVWAASRATARQEATAARMAEQQRVAWEYQQTATRREAAPEVRLFGLGGELMKRHEQVSRMVERAWIRSGVASAAEAFGARALFLACFAGSIGAVVAGAARGEVDTAEVALAVLLAQTVQQQIQDSTDMAAWLRKAAIASRRYAWLLDLSRRSRAAVQPVDAAPMPTAIEHGITFEGVSFAYPGVTERALDGVDLHLPAGSTVAIVGDNGAGKSTIVKLLARLYEPTDGRILVDGVPLRQFTPEDWRSRVSAGFQDHARFELTASHNVGFGHLPRLDDEPYQTAALERAGAGGLAAQMPAGLATQLGRRFADGHELSGGQWQKLAIGRAMAGPDPLLMLLDEPTAALDAHSEHALLDRYASISQESESGTITIIVSHRFSTLTSVDLVVLVDEGRVLEMGDHDELMAHGGRYAELFSLQAAAYRSNDEDPTG